MRFAPTPAAAPDDPLAGARYRVFTDLPGNEPSAAISPDGKFVVFIADIDGPDDVWIGQVGSTAYRNITKGTLGKGRAAGFANGGSDIWFGSKPFSPLRITQLMGGSARSFLGDNAGGPQQ